MLTTRIKADGVCPLPSTHQFVRLTKGGVEVSTTEGIISIGCDHPRILLRDILGDYISDISPDLHLGRAPLAYYIGSVEHSKRRSIGVPGPALVPDNVLLDKGTVLMETTSFADYHEFGSLQVVGIKANGGLIVGFAAASYMLTFSAAVVVSKVYRESVERDFLNSEAGHFTALPAEDFLNWVPAKRIHCREIVEVQHRPDTWGRAVEILTDLRGKPAHTACRARMTSKPGQSGIDI